MTDEKPDGLALAARMRSGELRLSPSRLWGECISELGDAPSDVVGEHYRHAMIHAGAVGPKTPDGAEWKPFSVCPTCNAELGEWNARIFTNESDRRN